MSIVCCDANAVSDRLRVVAVIPARGGSKGIARKNLRHVGGLPLVIRAAEQARQATMVDKVIVSTDDPEISELAKAHGTEVVVRPAAISGDTATSESALTHVLDTLQEREGRKPDVLVLIQCSSPLTTFEDIDGTVRALITENADSALAVAPFHYYLWNRDKDGVVVGINHDPATRRRRQDIEPHYLETGAVYAMRVQGFEHARHRFFGKIALYVIPRERCLEIDEPFELDVAEVLVRFARRGQQAALLPRPIEAVIFDFDGVFTDNRVLVTQDGQEAVWCHRGDGMGLEALRRRGIPVLVLSTERNAVVGARCTKLQLPYLSGVEDKRSALSDWLAERDLDRAHVVYVGNDVNDIECLAMVGCGVAVADAHPKVKRAARIVLSQAGGHGAIRELADLIMDVSPKP